MPSLPIRSNSAYQQEAMEDFLHACTIPMKLACNGSRDYPLVASHWFLYRDGALLCAMHRDSTVAKLLMSDNRCGFEIAPESIPYHGVRGQGRVKLVPEGAGELLGELIDRYLQSRDSKLAKWLLGRAEEELLVTVEPTWVTAWDYSDRMAG